ncbi:hypothetical protein NUV30_01445 [Kocuria rhizophila]|uniref:hypothetical protein n=1 Tax=Kocuria rhizophila TaxID=72000 RepID=UPI000F52F221|nr:hypothetical protein [Kocuria rhizophila]MCR4525048.1 hypothetical protein [Kocuria rhizophila]MDA4828407.1 hypothetical protein [Kocuria rhizophila]WSQ04597.1 hypothetical protein OG312_09310 [Kocuria rhizophila]
MPTPQDSPRPTPQDTDAMQGPREHPRVSLRAWTQQMDAYTGPDTLLDFNQVDNVCIDLTEANSSGQAQLLMQRPTRLSTMIHQNTPAYDRAVRSARALRTKIHELSVGHGLDAAYLAAGTASWLADPVADGLRRFIAPVLLAPVTVKLRPDHKDFELHIVGPAHLNPALVRRLREDHGVELTTAEMSRLAYGTRKLDPAPVLETLRQLAVEVPGMHVEHQLVVSTFADLHERPADEHVVARTRLVQDLARLKNSEVGKLPVVHTLTNDAPALDQRDPADELLLTDLDANQQEVVDLAEQGKTFVVGTPVGTAAVDTVVSTVGALVHRGRSVLVLGESRTTLAAFNRAWNRTGLDSLVLPLGSHLSPDDVAERLVRAVARNERTQEPHTEPIREALQRTREQLRVHEESLHTRRPRWQASPYEAMQALAELTARDPGPQTTVRFRRSVLDAVSHRGEVRRQLQRAAALGAFDPATLAGPWHGARLVNDDEARQAHDLAKSLLLELTTLSTAMRHVLGVSGLRVGSTIAEWEQQLELVIDVGNSLRHLTPDIYDRPVTDLIAATASASWRRDHEIELSGLQRSRLRKAAKEYIRPGVHLSDLHAALVKVQSERDRWRQWATTLEQPAVSDRAEETLRTHRRFREDLEGLAIALEGSVTAARLETATVDELQVILDELINDEAHLSTLPERTVLLEDLRARGLGEFLADLESRGVPAEQVDDELELAWWQSVLEAMISGDDFVAMPDGSQLRRTESAFRRADSAHIAAAPARLEHELATRWARDAKRFPREARTLRDMLRSGRVRTEELDRVQRLTPSLVPVWTASPLVLTATLGDEQAVDAVVILDAESTPLAATLPAVVKAEQVIAFGDPHAGGPQPFTVAPRVSARDTPQPVTEVDSAFETLSRVVDSRSLTSVRRPMDPRLFSYLNEAFYDGALTRVPYASELMGATTGLSAEYVVDGVGVLTAGSEGVQAPAAEVQRTVDLVFAHAARHPERSLAVVTASAMHAARVAQAVQRRLRESGESAEFFAPGHESFRVVELHRAAGIERDTVIFSLGFGRTTSGRSTPQLGSLSERDGRQAFVRGMTRSRRHTHIVTSIHPKDTELRRLQHGAKDMYHMLEVLFGEETTSERAPAPVDDPGAATDALVADLARRLRAAGATVHTGYAHAVDMAAHADAESLSAGAVLHRGDDDAPVRIPVALQSDGSDRSRALSVRERSRLIPQHLERAGWNYVSLWSVEVFTDPQTVAGLVQRYLGLPGGEAGSAAAQAPGAGQGSADRVG